MLAGPTLEAARALVGARLVHDGPDGPHGTDRPRAARIVEVEAYIGEGDQASHARFGRTRRNAVMYGPPGIAYVYLVYGMYECLNVVTEVAGQPAAVLVRAVEAVDAESAKAMRVGRWTWWRRRHRELGGRAVDEELARLAALPDARIASGPGLVCAALDITRAATGSDLLATGGALRIEEGERRPRVVATPRIGIGYAGEEWQAKPWRFVDADSAAVSGARPRGGATGRVRGGGRGSAPGSAS